MKRLLLKFAAAILVLLWVGCVFLWVHSVFTFDAIDLVTRPSGHFFELTAESLRGFVAIQVQHVSPQSLAVPTDPDGFSHTTDPTVVTQLAATAQPWHGITIGYSDDFAYAALLSAATPGFNDHLNHYDRTRSVWFPLWIPTVVLSVMIMLVFRQLRHRRLPGACQSCGYDLRGTPGRCPECGRIANTVNSSK